MGDPVAQSTFGRFDHSFVMRMMRDFFLLLLLLGVLELAVKFLLVYHNFKDEQEYLTRNAAETLAADVKSIMLNEGGPVAARTVYPILRKQYGERGLNIAIIPSEVTVQSIEDLFDFTAKGSPAAWPKINGDFHETAVVIEAEEFCRSCHVLAKPGDVLGHVVVRNYFDYHLHQWWDAVLLTGTFSFAKIVFHTVVLFLLLKFRMEALLVLRSAVGALARAGADLSPRARVISHDEFGELAHDLNAFLDRIAGIIDELRQVMAGIASANRSLNRLTVRFGERVQSMETDVVRVARESFRFNRGDPMLSEEWLGALDRKLDALRAGPADGADLASQVGAVLTDLRVIGQRAADMAQDYYAYGESALDVSAHLGDLSQLNSEMAVLEAKMDGIAKQGQSLVDRLTPESATGGAPGSQ